MKIVSVNDIEFREEILYRLGVEISSSIGSISRAVHNGMNGHMPERMLGEILYVKFADVMRMGNVANAHLSRVSYIQIRTRLCTGSEIVFRGYKNAVDSIFMDLCTEYNKDYMLIAGHMFHELTAYIASDATNRISKSLFYYIVMLYMVIIHKALFFYEQILSN